MKHFIWLSTTMQIIDLMTDRNGNVHEVVPDKPRSASWRSTSGLLQMLLGIWPVIVKSGGCNDPSPVKWSSEWVHYLLTCPDRSRLPEIWRHFVCYQFFDVRPARPLFRYFRCLWARYILRSKECCQWSCVWKSGVQWHSGGQPKAVIVKFFGGCQDDELAWVVTHHIGGNSIISICACCTRCSGLLWSAVDLLTTNRQLTRPYIINIWPVIIRRKA